MEKKNLFPHSKNIIAIFSDLNFFLSGLVVEDAERATIAKDLGPNNKVNCSV